MSAEYEKNVIINGIIAVEGGYVNDPFDSGGETNFGITKAVAVENGYMGNMQDMPKATAFNIYEAKYWNKMHLDEIATISQKVAAELATIGVNMGTPRAITFLQRSLNVLNNQQEYYPDIAADGGCGSVTLKALRSYYTRRGNAGMDVLAAIIKCLQGAFYISISENSPKDEKFVYGWFANRIL